MRTIKKRVLKPLLFVCLCLFIAISVFAVVPPDEPSPPGRPSAYDIGREWCQLSFRKPQRDGGEPLRYYEIQYRTPDDLKWYFDSRVEHQRNIDGYIRCKVDNRVGASQVAYRAIAYNIVGPSNPSLASDYIIFRNPF